MSPSISLSCPSCHSSLTSYYSFTHLAPAPPAFCLFLRLPALAVGSCCFLCLKSLIPGLPTADFFASFRPYCISPSSVIQNMCHSQLQISQPSVVGVCGCEAEVKMGTRPCSTGPPTHSIAWPLYSLGLLGTLYRIIHSNLMRNNECVEDCLDQA